MFDVICAILMTAIIIYGVYALAMWIHYGKDSDFMRK